MPALWRWKGFAAPRPLYGLEHLAARPDADVLVVEGEKTAEAARERLPEHVAITWPGGANGLGKIDWTPLRGRTVVIWPDADEPGRKAAERAATAIMRAGAAAVTVVRVPNGLPDGWDLADPIPADIDGDHLLAAAKPASAETEMPFGYAMTERGLVWRDPSDDDKPEILLTSPFQVVAETRDGDGGSWACCSNGRTMTDASIASRSRAP